MVGMFFFPPRGDDMKTTEVGLTLDKTQPFLDFKVSFSFVL